MKRNWVGIILILLVIFLVSSFLAGVLSLFFAFGTLPEFGNVALIKIQGPISTVEVRSIAGGAISSSDIIDKIEKAAEDPSIKAVIFEINSPGGSAVASEEVANAISKLNKTTVAFIRDVGASGGYWIASASEHVIANRMSITGSIGVIASYLDFSGFISDYNVTYQRLVAGKYKDMGTPLRQLLPEEEAMFQEKLDKIHEIFIEEIAANRNMTVEEVRKIAEGNFYLGIEAFELGLVDQLGGKDEAIAYVEDKLGIKADLAEYKTRRSIFDLLSESLDDNAFMVGQGIGSAIFGDRSPKFV